MFDNSKRYFNLQDFQVIPPGEGKYVFDNSKEYFNLQDFVDIQVFPPGEGKYVFQNSKEYFNLRTQPNPTQQTLEWLPDLPGLEQVLGSIPRVV